MGIQTLDPVHDARHALADKPNARESLAFVVGIAEAQAAFIAYTWVNDKSEAGSALAVFGPGVGEEPIFEHTDGIAVPADQGFDDWQVGPITVRHGAPLKEASVAFAGERASVDYTFEGMHDAYNYGQHPEGCPWYLADDRFEQSGRVKGTLKIGDKVVEFDQTGHRDHSWGTRNWGAIQHWKWVWAQTAEGSAVHVLETFGLGVRQVYGYVHKDGVIGEVIGLKDAKFDIGPDLFHKNYSATLIDNEGRETVMTYRPHSQFAFPVAPEATMHEVSMIATIDGFEGPGHVEMGWPKDYLTRAQGDPGIAARFG